MCVRLFAYFLVYLLPSFIKDWVIMETIFSIMIQKITTYFLIFDVSLLFALVFPPPLLFLPLNTQPIVFFLVFFYIIIIIIIIIIILFFWRGYYIVTKKDISVHLYTLHLLHSKCASTSLAIIMHFRTTTT